MIIDRSNWPANRPAPGDRVLNAKGDEVAEVLAIRKDRDAGLYRLRVRSLDHGHEYFAGFRWQSWEDWLEAGGRLRRNGDEG